jgi:hypothetical protein
LTGFEEIKNSLMETHNTEDFILQFEFGKWMIEGKLKKKLYKKL